MHCLFKLQLSTYITADIFSHPFIIAKYVNTLQWNSTMPFSLRTICANWFGHNRPLKNTKTRKKSIKTVRLWLLFTVFCQAGRQLWKYNAIFYIPYSEQVEVLKGEPKTQCNASNIMIKYANERFHAWTV